MSSDRPGEKLHAPDTDLMNAAADAGVPPWELPRLAHMTDDEKRVLTEHYQRIASQRRDAR